VNRFLCERSIEERYATMFYGVLTRTGAIEYVNAGHVPAILRRKTGELEALESSNFPVGLFPDAEFLNGTACMAKDDFLVIYTDGVSEATNLRGELLGDTGLRKIIQDFAGENVDELAELIRHGVQLFTGGAPQSDDITLLVIQYRGSGA
jgi:sigma-B regulation protein RsbU (phosphoserine phosphatase)